MGEGERLMAPLALLAFLVGGRVAHVSPDCPPSSGRCNSKKKFTAFLDCWDHSLKWQAPFLHFHLELMEHLVAAEPAGKPGRRARPSSRATHPPTRPPLVSGGHTNISI